MALTRTDDATVMSFIHENIQIVQKADGSCVWVVNTRTSRPSGSDGGYTYKEAYTTPLVTIMGVTGDQISTGANTRQFVSGGCTVLFHSGSTYWNGEIRANHYWEKAG